ncbi:MAG: PTS sugar transporter subunit IIA [Chloroflexota bacterium]|nr:MAG: PTS sugar transporter subunit IIA [Chloroflexota bacterium]
MMNKLLELLEPGAVKLGLEAGDAREVVSILGEKLLEAGYVLDTFIEAALQRESELPTGLPLAGDFNAAIPHTDIEHVLKPGLALATLIEPVVFHNMVSPEEDVPVQLVILMALDEPKAQVEMLQEIAGVLQDAEVINKLMVAKDFNDVQAALS